MSRPAPRLSHDQILNAAASAFASQGFAATTMKDIAREAGCTAPAIYGYYDSKLEVYEAIIGRMRTALLDAIDAACPDGLTRAQRVELLLIRQFEVAERHRTELSIFFALRSSGVPARSKRRAEQPRGLDLYCDALERWIVSVFEVEALAPLTPRMMAFALSGLVTSFFRMWLAGPEGERLVVLAPTVRRLFLDGVEGTAGLAAGQAS